MATENTPSRAEVEKECRDDIYSGMTMGSIVFGIIGGGIGAPLV